jgi:hypothetical protein
MPCDQHNSFRDLVFGYEPAALFALLKSQAEKYRSLICCERKHYSFAPSEHILPLDLASFMPLLKMKIITSSKV